MYGVTLRGPASRLPASLRHVFGFVGRARGAAMAVWLEDTPVAVTTMRRMARTCEWLGRRAWRLRAAARASRRGRWTGFGAGLRGGGRLHGRGFRRSLGCDGFAAGFFAVNLGFSAFFGLAGFAAALFAASWSLQARIRKGAGLQDAGLYRPTFPCTAL